MTTGQIIIIAALLAGLVWFAYWVYKELKNIDNALDITFARVNKRLLKLEKQND